MLLAPLLSLVLPVLTQTAMAVDFTASDGQDGPATGSGAVFVKKGGTLKGFGETGTVQLEYGGTVQPQNSGLAVENLFWAEGGQLQFEVGPKAAELKVAGVLKRNSESGKFLLRIDDAGGTAGRLYTLMEFGSTDFTAADFEVIGTKGELAMTSGALKFRPLEPESDLVRSVSVESRRAGRSSATFVVTNTGTLPDQYRLAESRRGGRNRGEGRGRKLARVECRVFLNGRDMTRAVERGTALTASLEAGEQAVLQMRVSVRRPLHRDKKLVSMPVARSMGDGSVRQDARVAIELPASGNS